MDRLPDLNASSPTDRNPCWITGVALSPPNRLLLADNNNRCVKSLLTSTGTITATFPLVSCPWDIAILGPNMAVVTLPETEEIGVISTNNGFTTNRSISASGKCYGIASTSDKLIVSYAKPGAVKILDYYGNVSQVISCSSSCPRYVTVSNENGQDAIHFSDWNTKTITKVSMTGDVLYKYHDPDIRPNGIAAIDDRHIVACEQNSETIKLVTWNGSTVSTLLDTSYGIEYPRSVCCNETEGILYISCDGMRSKWVRRYRLA